MSNRAERLAAPLARRIALAAQGFADPRPTGVVDSRQLRRVTERLVPGTVVICRVLRHEPYGIIVEEVARQAYSTIAWAATSHEQRAEN